MYNVPPSFHQITHHDPALWQSRPWSLCLGQCLNPSKPDRGARDDRAVWPSAPGQSCIYRPHIFAELKLFNREVFGSRHNGEGAFPFIFVCWTLSPGPLCLASRAVRASDHSLRFTCHESASTQNWKQECPW